MSAPESPQRHSVEEGIRLFLLNETPLGLLYQRFLKRFRVVRWAVIQSWKYLLPLGLRAYARLFRHAVPRLPLLKLSDVATTVVEVSSPQQVVTPVPEVLPARLARRCASPHEAITFPRLYITRLQDLLVRGGSNFLRGGGALVHHDLFRASHDYTSEELHGHMAIRAKTGKVFVFVASADDVHEEIAEAAVFTDAVAPNYAHFMTEVLPRLHMFVRHAPAHVPLVIDAALHANLQAAIRLVAGEDRPLIRLQAGQLLRVRDLWVMSVCGYVPFERRPGTARLQDHSQGVFSPVALQSMRDAIKTSLHVAADAPSGRKVFIRRNSGYRNVINAHEIEDRLVACGFDVVEPEKLTFAGQVALFSSAAVVVGATGAAFANLVFCRPDCRVVILIAELEGTSYYYWQNIASACGGRVCYVLGQIEERRFRSIHSDFRVDPDDVLAAVQGPVADAVRPAGAVRR